MQQVPIYDIWRILSQPRVEAEAEIRACCKTAFLGDHEAIARILGRYKIYVDTRDIGISSHLMMDGFWEMWVTEAMMKLVRRGSVVADIGANLGYFTLLLADLTGAEGRVLSFEPNPNLASRLSKSIEINGFKGFTDFYDIALGAEEGMVTLEVSDHQPGGGRTHSKFDDGEEDEAPEAEPDGETDRDAGASPRSRFLHFLFPEPHHLNESHKSVPKAGAAPVEGQIRVARFDEIPHAMDVEFIKIDVEGFEPYVWQGMTKRLESDRPLTIFMEFTIDRFPDARGFLNEITSRGFSLEIITFNEGVKPVSPDELFAMPHDVDNMLVFRRE